MAGRILPQISARLKIGLAVVLLLVGIQYLLLPLVQWQHRIVAKVGTLQSAIARKKALIGNEEKVSTVFKNSSSTLDKWRQQFLTGPTDARELQLKMQKKVERLAEELAISTENVDWLPSAAEGLIRGAVRFQLEAVPQDFIKLLYALETEPHFIAVDGVRINARGRSTTFSAELDISAYAIPPDGIGR